MSLIAHAIVATPPIGVSTAGLRGRALVAVDCGELGLWATELDPEVRLEREDAFAHHRVVEQVCAAQACLPVRFGTAFGSAERARLSIEERRDDLVRSLARDASKNGNKFSALVLGIVKSKPFQMNMKMQETSIQPNKEKGN